MSGCWRTASWLLPMVFGIGRAVANETASGDLVSKVVFFLLMTIPYQGFFIWAVCWLTLDAIRERRGARAAAMAGGRVTRRES
jgi:hypothetical protein